MSESKAVVTHRPSPRSAGAVTGLLAGLLMLGGALWGTGYLLRFDMVFTPHLTLNPATLGIDGSVPRAVPNDIVVALLDLVLPGWVTQRLILLGAFIALGAAWDRVPFSRTSRMVAAAFACWNPWVAERLLIGHWGYLWGAAGVMWVVASARIPQDRIAHRTALVGVVLGSLSGSTGAVLTLLAYLVVWAGVRTTSWARTGRVLLLWVALNAVWWWPFLTAPSHPADPHGVTAFAAKAESGAGVLVSVLGGGGIWHAASWPPERLTVVLTLISAAVVAGTAALAGRRRLWTLAGCGVALAVWGAVPGASAVLQWTVLHLPGGGLLRDGQKFAVLTVAVAALGAAVGVERMRGRLPQLWRVLCVGVPVALLPGMLWGAFGTVQSHRYPVSVTAAANWINTHSTPEQTTLVLPWTLYRQYAWNGQQVVLDPWPRLLHTPTLVNDDLPLRNLTVAGESAAADRVTTVLARRDAAAVMAGLRAENIRFVVDQPGQRGARTTSWVGSDACPLRYTSAQVRVCEIANVAAHRTAASTPHPVWTVRALGLWVSAMTYAGLLGSAALRRWRGRSRRP